MIYKQEKQMMLLNNIRRLPVGNTLTRTYVADADLLISITII